MKTLAHIKLFNEYNLNPPLCKCCSKPIPYEHRKNRYCDRSCAAKITNLVPKRKLRNRCVTCNKPIRCNATYCKSCYRSQLFGEQPISYLMRLKGSNKYVSIRQHAHRVIKGRTRVCAHCGYDKHVEVCHVKAICKFPPDTLIKVANDPNNLIYLCPNCHWEHDH
jgi:hypothetical protein